MTKAEAPNARLPRRPPLQDETEAPVQDFADDLAELVHSAAQNATEALLRDRLASLESSGRREA